MDYGSLVERIEMRVPAGWTVAVDTAAAKAGVSKSDYMRAAVSAALADETRVAAARLRTLALPRADPP